MSLINIAKLTFAYDGSYDNIFENVSFQIDTDWKLGFIGRNGRGKTTFLKLLLGQYEFSGSISASVDFEYFPFDVFKIDSNTIDIIYEIYPEVVYWQLIRELSLLQVAEDVLWRAFKTLSNGERTKILLAVLFLKPNRFLLIDEPTNHLDLTARKIVSDYLQTKKGFILVSHDRIFLDNCIDHVLSINKANIEIQQGKFSNWWQNKQMQDNFELAENAKLNNEIRQMSEAIKRTSVWSGKIEKTKFGIRNSGIKPDKGYIGHQAARMMKRSKAIENRKRTVIDEKSKLLKNIESADSLKIIHLPFHSSRLVELENISIYYGEKEVCSNLSFNVEQGDRVALVGKNGCGKSSIIKLICGDDIIHTGVIHINSQLIISYVPQDTSFLSGSLTDYARENGIDHSLFKAMLRKLDFSRVQFEKDIAEFSAGQKKKVLIAASLSQRAHLYIWDEPLNYIDLISRMQIEELLLECQPTIIFVEHDKAFIENIATKTIEL